MNSRYSTSHQVGDVETTEAVFEGHVVVEAKWIRLPAAFVRGGAAMTVADSRLIRNIRGRDRSGVRSAERARQLGLVETREPRAIGWAIVGVVRRSARVLSF